MPLHIDSYYAASANRTDPRAALQGDVEADVCVVGGGFSGLSTALALAERGFDVCLLEAHGIGFGASGRNGGQVVNGLNASLPKIERQFGSDTAAFVGGMVQEGGRIIRERIERYDIACDWRPGNIFAAYTGAHMRDLEAKQALWRKHGMDEHELLDRDAIRTHVASDVYAGGMIDHSGGHLHPLNLAQGEADAIEQLGGRVFERSPALSIETEGVSHRVRSAEGSVRSRILVLCGNAYMTGVAPEIEGRIMPVSTQIVTTAPLGEERAQALLPTGMCVEDVRYILDYYRLTADHRLLFGGGTVYGGTDPADVRAKLRPNMEKVFPQLRGVELEYAWSGNFALSYSRVPQMGRTNTGAYFAHGYSGHGVTGSHLYGVILAEAIAGDQSRFDVFAGLPYLSFPGGRAMRVPYSVAGSWWYGLRDRLGI
ncbi:MAG TPA: FAD-binding oxidoreductase [Pseudomonadales bacterium]|nr:FAD-binding oxidoreductase [Pseudomonadales bacterium]